MNHFQNGGGSGENTRIGEKNRNDQVCLGTRDVSGTDHKAKSYAMFCLHCGQLYGANGTDVFQRKCPGCQGGKSGIEY
ncbi:MAG: hypothetical protein ACR2P7_02230 [bacterium]